MTADGAARPRSLSGPIRGDRRSDPAWRPFVSARSRILGWSVALLAAAATATTIATHAFLVASMNSRVHSELTHEIAEFRALAARYGATRPAEPHEDNSRSHAARAITVTGLMRARTSSAVLENDTVLIGVIAGRIVTTSKNFNPADGPGPTVLARWSALTGPAAGTVVMARGPGRFQAIPVRLPGQRPATFVAVSLIASQQTGIDSITRLQILVGAIALLAGSALAWLIAGRVLRPVRDTTELARRITESDLSERIPARGSDEISALAVTFNRMLDRLESAMTAQRSFLADAGHELRTPITIIQGNLDTLSVTSADDAETLGIVADEIGRMSRMVDDLLLLASSERPDFLHPVPTDLGRLTRSLVAKARALDNRPWSMAGAAEQVVLLDRQRVTQAVMQLAANAVAHTPPGTPVEIGSRFTGQAVVFSVADRGPGIPATDRHRVLERFTRLEPGRTGGSGLGLAIVAAIAAAHDGHVDIGERDGGGTLVSLTLRCALAPAPAGQDRP
ncbi:MAG TPA: HAMP domain-containing sensor histidine kinase [Streptosporangiaceae bacterium]